MQQIQANTSYSKLLRKVYFLKFVADPYKKIEDNNISCF